MKVTIEEVSKYLKEKVRNVYITWYPNSYFDREAVRFMPRDSGIFTVFLDDGTGIKQSSFSLYSDDGKAVALVDDWMSLFDDLIKKEMTEDESKTKKGA